MYGIVKQSGGYIWVYSEPGHGTTFKLYFPAITAALENPLARDQTHSEPSGQTILIVEDEATIRGNVRECLQQLGYQVVEAESGEAALQVCDDLRGKIDLVLTDLVMPGMGGYELAGELEQFKNYCSRASTGRAALQRRVPADPSPPSRLQPAAPRLHK